MDERLDAAFRFQIGGCRVFESELYARLLEHAQQDCEAGGPCALLLVGWPGDPLRDFLLLRFLGAVHARVLAGEAPELARHYPSVGGMPEWPGVWQAFLGVVEEQADALRPQLETFPQTNEVRRCAGLLGGFLEVARRYPGSRQRLREIGTSAGLNLFWDRYHYTLAPHEWGTRGSAVKLEAEWSGGSAAFEQVPEIESRAGCDIAPVRLADAAGRLRLESYVWPDQPERLTHLRGAVEIARADPARIEEARAGEWLAGELADAPDGVARIVFHSSVWLYIPEDERARIVDVLESAGAEATAERPLAWLRHEDSDERPGRMELLLRSWPGGQEEKLADGHPHGRKVDWLGG